MIPPSVAISIENGGDSATPIQLAFLACLGHIDLTCSWAREREKEAWFDQTLIFLGKLPLSSASYPSKAFLTCNKAYFFRKIFDLVAIHNCRCKVTRRRIQEKLLHIVSNGEKLSSNRRGGTARSFGDKCFLRRSDPVERKSSSFFSSLRKAIVNIRAELLTLLEIEKKNPLTRGKEALNLAPNGVLNCLRTFRSSKILIKRVPKSRRAPIRILREYDRYLSPHFWCTSLRSKLGMINLHKQLSRPFSNSGIDMDLSEEGALALFHIQFSEEDSQKRILRIRLTGVHAFLRETKEAQIYLLGGKGNERLVLPLKRSCRLCQSEVHTADQLPLPRYGLDAPPARAGLSDGYDRTIDSHSSAFRLSYGIKFFSGKPTKQANLFYDRSFRSACLFIRARVLNISLAARSEPERISDRLEDPVSNAPLAFNSQGELSASSLVPRGEGPSNSEVGSQYTDTPVIDRDLSLVTGEHSEGKPALAFSTPTGISLGGSSEPLTLSPDHKPLGDPVTVRKSSAIRESSSSFAGTLFSKGSEVSRGEAGWN
ncbi:hypothetical protein L1987_88408 [Smallanthus sonchifolius]|nr:hypothetical protein L1987_88408 [Smallanthus sonchifolius]